MGVGVGGGGGGRKKARRGGAMPSDHRALFDGNADDHFRLGIKVTKSSCKLYADFYKADLIVASPLGLATIANDVTHQSSATARGGGRGREGERGGREGGPEGALDFLSSIEVLVLDHVDVLRMQNWEHVLTVVEGANRTPQQMRGADVTRIRDWCLAGWGAAYRQTIAMGAHAAADINAAMHGK